MTAATFAYLSTKNSMRSRQMTLALPTFPQEDTQGTMCVRLCLRVRSSLEVGVVGPREVSGSAHELRHGVGQGADHHLGVLPRPLRLVLATTETTRRGREWSKHGITHKTGHVSSAVSKRVYR